LLNIAGDICKSLGRYDNAVDYWNKSYEINNEFCDTLYSKACMYMDLGRKEEAIKAWEVVIKWLEEHQLEYETIWPKREIEKLKNKLK
jgi:tetratricopeptide (TPR) repeat protein